MTSLFLATAGVLFDAVAAAVIGGSWVIVMAGGIFGVKGFVKRSLINLSVTKRKTIFH